MQERQNYFQYRYDYFSDAVNRNKFTYLKEYVRRHDPSRLLEVGSGKGVLSIELRNLAREIYGIEFEPRRVEDSNRFKQETETDNVFFQRGDARKLPFPDNHFDMVICSQVLEHVENPEEAVREMMRVAKDVILVDVPTPVWEGWQFAQWGWNKLKNPGNTIKRYKETKVEGTASIKRAFQPGHVNKWSPWKWKNLLEENGLEIRETAGAYMSLTKKFNLLGPVEKMIRKTKPFSYMGMVFFIEAHKRRETDSSTSSS